MGKALLLGVSVLLCCALAVSGQSVKCNVCNFRIGGLCFHPGSDCTPSKTNETCVTTKAFLGKTPLFTRYGCGSIQNCNVTDKKDAIFEVTYDRTCCSTNLCNTGIAVSSLGLPVLAGMSLMLGWWMGH